MPNRKAAIFFILLLLAFSFLSEATESLIDYKSIKTIGKPTKISTEIISLAKNGKLQSQYELANYLTDGKVFEKNYTLAAQLYEAVINRFQLEKIKMDEPLYIESCYRLAYLLENDLGVEGGHESAVALYKRTAALGSLKSLARLADLYRYGKGVAQDDDMYLILMRAQLAHGNANLQNLESIEKGL